MKGIERIGEKFFDFIKNWGSIFIDIDDVKNAKFHIKSVWVFYDRKKSSALLMLSSARILLARVSNTGNQEIGAVAQLGARLHGMQEVAGSSPASSTFKYNGLTDFG